MDVFDALTSARSYKPAMSLTLALATMEADSGRHFDPGVVSAFVEIASGLYDRIAMADEEALRREMRRMLLRNFRTAERLE